MVEEIDDTPPQEAFIGQINNDLVRTVSGFSKHIRKIALWLLAWRETKDGRYIQDTGRTAIMNEQGADAYCSWLDSITASPLPFARHAHNEAAWKLIFNESTICKMLIENEEDWALDFDKYADMLVDISDILGTAAISGSIDGQTLERFTANYLIHQKIGGETEKGGMGRLTNIFRRNKGDSQS